MRSTLGFLCLTLAPPAAAAQATAPANDQGTAGTEYIVLPEGTDNRVNAYVTYNF